MKILLISPAGSDLYAKTGVQLPPLGLMYIAAFARKHRHEVALIDVGVDKEALETTKFENYDLIGISADTPRYPEAIEIAKLAKKAGKLVVMGGYHVTFLDEATLATGVVDYVVRGEGEEIFVNLLKGIEGKMSLKEIDGISYFDKGKYNKNKDAPLPTNLDEFPFPARDLLPIKDYNGKIVGVPLANLITSRGCPYDCYFCSSTNFGGLKWRARSAKSIVDEVEVLYHKYNYRAFAFMDDNFTLRKKRVMDFADELKKRGLTDIIWWCFSRVDILARNEDMVKRMAEVGAFQIFLGLESVNEDTLDDYGKRIANDQQMEAINMLRKYNIRIHGSFIMGGIDEDEEKIMETVNWVKDVNPDIAQFSVLTPYPGTALFTDMEKQNRFLHKEWELFDALHPTIKLNHLSPPDIIRILMKSYREVYIRWSRIFTKRKHRPLPQIKVSWKQKLSKTVMPISFFLTFRNEMNRTVRKFSFLSEKSTAE